MQDEHKILNSLPLPSTLPNTLPSAGNSHFTSCALFERLAKGRTLAGSVSCDNIGNSESKTTSYLPDFTRRPFELPARDPNARDASPSILLASGGEFDIPKAPKFLEDCNHDVVLRSASLSPAECGSEIECHYELLGTLANENGVLSFLTFIWYRSFDLNQWIPMYRGTRTTSAHIYLTSADDLGQYIRCEVALDEQAPITTKPVIILLSPTHKEEMKQVLEDGVCGFHVHAKSPIIYEGSVSKDAPPSNEETNVSMHIVFVPKFVRLYAKTKEGSIKIVAKSTWLRECTIQLDSDDPYKFHLSLPTGGFDLYILRRNARDCLAFMFRLFQAMALRDIGHQLLSPSICNDFRYGRFKWTSLSAPQDSASKVRGDPLSLSIDPDMRGHELKKHGLGWMMAKEALRAILS